MSEEMLFRKRITALVLTAILLYGTGGHIAAFYLLRAEAREEAAERIAKHSEETNPTVLLFSPAEYARLNWTGGEEFRFQDEMYDVIKQEKDEQGNITLYCLSDSKEEALLAQWERQTQERAARKAGLIIPSIPVFFCCQASEPAPLTAEGRPHLFAPFTFAFPSFSEVRFSPPPELG